MAIDTASLAVAALLGALLGAGYLVALWAATRRLARSPRPVAWLLGGAVARIAALLGLLYLAADGEGARLLAALAGFVAMRIAVTRWASRGLAPVQNR
jgi:F1F0 ATPase subunit 2